MASADELMDQALRAEDAGVRRQAFVQLLRSDDWRMVLAPHVVSCQGYRVGESMIPDWATFTEAAVAIAEDDAKVQRSLELAGSRFSGALLSALAKQMKTDLVESALAHLRTADGVRSSLLQRVLQEADPSWVKHALAGPSIRKQLRVQEHSRIDLMLWLAKADNLGDYIKEIKESPPTALEEWSALGKGRVFDEQLYNLAMATMPHSPAPILYLMRLDPIPEDVIHRVMAAARGEWVATALEMAILDGLDTTRLVPLAEIGVRLGGRSLAAATAWISASKLAKELLIRLAVEFEQSGDRERVNEMLWIRRRAPSGDRALERGRRDEEIDAWDAVALVRQLRGEKVIEIVEEILTKPRPNMIEPVLHLLCAVNEDAARRVVSFCESENPEIAQRAKDSRAWADVAWPPEDTTQEIM